MAHVETAMQEMGALLRAVRWIEDEAHRYGSMKAVMVRQVIDPEPALRIHWALITGETGQADLTFDWIMGLGVDEVVNQLPRRIRGVFQRQLGVLAGDEEEACR